LTLHKRNHASDLEIYLSCARLVPRKLAKCHHRASANLPKSEFYCMGHPAINSFLLKIKNNQKIPQNTHIKRPRP
jgi:hypothetical protein